MTTKTIDVREMQPNLDELLSLVGDGTEVILTDGEVPLARLIPLHTPPANDAARPRIPGLHAGAIWTSDDFDEPLPDEFWTGIE
jgi:antitoxin (DNA-binding transcriptional repressor) of toxin-antitoxin stability system